MAQIDAEALALRLIGGIAHGILNDSMWKAFGFKGVPRRGSLFNRFVDPQKVLKEKFLSREFAVVGLTLSARSAKTHLDRVWAPVIVSRLFSYCSVEFLSGLMFDSFDPCIQYLEDGVRQFAPANPTQYGELLLERMERLVGIRSSGIDFHGCSLIMTPSHSIFPAMVAISREVCRDMEPVGKVLIDPDKQLRTVRAAVTSLDAMEPWPEKTD